MRQIGIAVLSILGLLLVGDFSVGANHRHGPRAIGQAHGWRQSFHPSEHGHNDYDPYEFGQQTQVYDDIGDDHDTQQTVNNEDFEGIVPAKHYVTTRPESTTPRNSETITPARYRGQNHPEVTTSLGKIRGQKVR